ncbi:hypothetical protein M409DRAFT_17273 [Zasmidium cellare ATCC 36951]|uniref:Uncharacterized protein n=1 Tax=Zasmidium cellare ATCC 36951 TaxID=1080233 RepID=A0A6A6D2L6_ZASCE|nr:uncharacterized protein M409DRAFT_17273 [Zasmidium cellare ATCC 36951]KAF2173333.1 hypothetical protein M409DRAFT_17273 [Zasmidium cellare ATCC 36951]
MAYLTPPSSKRKNRSVFNKHRQPIYYEDLYGEMNKDEEFDRYPDKCETESESERDFETDESPLQRKSSQRPSRSLKRKRGEQDTGQDSNDGLLVSEDEDNGTQYKIAPKLNSKRSIPVPPMTPKKFGMFGSKDHTKKAQKATLPDNEKAQPEEPSPKKANTRERTGRIKRSASRQLLKQQLADLDKSKKEARRTERARQKAAKASKGAVKVKKMRVKGGSRLKQAGGMSKSLLVYIDNDDIDREEYERFDD